MLDANDPRLTAYVLGELDGEEAAEVQQAVEASPELQDAVRELQKTADVLSGVLQSEPFAALTDQQRARLLESSESPENSPAVAKPPSAAPSSPFSDPTVERGFSMGRWMAIAASLLLLAGVPYVLYRVVPQMRDLGVAMAPDETPSTAKMVGVEEGSGDESSVQMPAEPANGLDRGSLEESAPAADDGPRNASRRQMLTERAPFGGDRDRYRAEERAGASSGPGKRGGYGQGAGRVEGPGGPSPSSPPGIIIGDSETTTGPLVRRADPSLTPAPNPPPVNAEANEKVSPVRNPVQFGNADDGASPEKSGEPSSKTNRPFGRPSESADATKPRDRTPGDGREVGGKLAEGIRSGKRGLGDGQVRGDRPDDGLQEGGQQGQQGKAVNALDNLRIGLNQKLKESNKSAQDGEGEDGKNQSDREKAADEKESKGKQAGWKRPAATPNATRLKVGDRDALPLKGVQANVYIDGFRARVVLDYYYYNDRGNQLQGEFQLRLPNEASLYYFAFGQSTYQYKPMVDQLASGAFLSGDLVRAAGGLGPRDIATARKDTWGNVKEARLVQREKAAHAYSEVVRRRVDPALVEWSGAGIFNAKVFPLMPRKLHRIVVGYDMNLRTVGEDLHFRLDLPQDIPEAMVDVSIAALPGSEAIVEPNARPFTSGGRAYFHFPNPKTGAVEVRMKNTNNVTLTGGDEETGEFFATRVAPPLPSGDLQSGSRRAVFLLDTSLSSNPDKFNVWLKLLEETLKQNRDSMEEFAVLQFNIETHWWKSRFVANNEANVESLMAHCQTLALEGATDLERAITEAIDPAWLDTEQETSADLFLLSDGAATWGETEHAALLHLLNNDVGAIFAYNTGMSETSIDTLQALTRQTGGALFTVASEDELKKAATAHRRRPWRLVEARIDGCEDLLISGRPSMLYPGQELLVVGRGNPGANSQIKFRVKRGDKVRTIAVPLHESLASETAVRLYGQVAVAQLEGIPHGADDLATAYARHFRITGRSCSLLMLESEADYRRYNIKPEDDAFVVSSGPADVAILQRLDEIGEKLASEKAAMRSWLEKLRNLQGVNFQIGAGLRVALDKLPESAFHVKRPKLECRDWTVKDLPKKYFQHLSATTLNYDTINNEAQRRVKQYGAADSLRALSCLIERQPGDIVLTRDVAFTAMQWGLPGEAYPLLKRVARSRPHEPQIYQAIGHCLSEMGNADLAMIYYEIAHGGNWHQRYKDVKQIAGVEYLDMLRRVETGELETEVSHFAKARLNRLSKDLRVKRSDLVVTMMWNTDRTDIDLHVIEPSGEECYFKHRNTRTGGRITGDVTEGFGPEMYAIDKAPHGTYKVLANYYGTDANRTQVRTKVYVNIYENFGDPKRQRVTRKTISLSRGKQKIELATVNIEK